MGANFGIAGVDWQQRVNWDRLRTYRTERAREMMKKHGLGAVLCMSGGEESVHSGGRAAAVCGGVLRDGDDLGTVSAGAARKRTLWKTTALFLTVGGLVVGLLGVMTALFEQVDRRSEERRIRQREGRPRGSGRSAGPGMRGR